MTSGKTRESSKYLYGNFAGWNSRPAPHPCFRTYPLPVHAATLGGDITPGGDYSREYAPEKITGHSLPDKVQTAPRGNKIRAWSTEFRGGGNAAAAGGRGAPFLSRVKMDECPYPATG